MAILPVLQRPDGVTCSDWESGGDPHRPKRCKYIAREAVSDVPKRAPGPELQLENGMVWRGACRLPSYLMCTEWLKLHPELKMPSHAPAEPSGPTPHAPAPPAALAPLPPVSRDMFGNIEPDPPIKAAAVGSAASPASASTLGVVRQLRPSTGQPGPRATPAAAEPPEPVVSDRWVRLLEESGVEVELAREGRPSLHLVAARTGQDRTEITFVELALIRAALDVLPAKLVTVRRVLTGGTSSERSVEDLVELEPQERLLERLKRLDPRTGVPKDEIDARTAEALTGGLR